MSIKGYALATALLAACGAARANEADDEIQRLVAQAQEEAANHETGEVARTVDEVSRLVPTATPAGMAAMGRLMEGLDRMLRDVPDAPPPDAPRNTPANAPADAPPNPPASPPAQADAAPAPSTPATPDPIPPGVLDLLQRRGTEAMQAGDISGARRYFGRGAEAGCAPCAEAMARTFDPRELRRIGAIGTTPDPASAQWWRNRARQLAAAGTP